MGATTIASYTYTLGPAGNRTALDELSGRHIDWQYDDLYRLTGESITDATNGDREQTYEYDDVGNRTSLTDSTASGPTAYEYDDADHLLERTPDGSGSTAYAWDTAGRNTLIGATPYVWNPWDRLTKKDDGSATTFGYSPDGIVRTKEWKTTSPSTTQKRRYVYDRTLPYAQLLQEWDNVGNKVMADYLYLDGDLIGFKDERTGSVARYWILKDGQNSVRKVVDTTGAVVASYDYDAWGNVLGQTQPSGWIFNHRAFGEVLDPNLGMTYLRARWMDPGTGRFASRDLFGGVLTDPGSLHRYSYADQNPLNLLDPSGLMPTLVELLVATAIIGTLAITDAKASTETSGPAARTKTIQPHRIDVKNEPTVDTKDQIDTAASIWSQIGWKLQFLPEIIHSEAFSYPGISIPIDLMSNIFVTEAAARQGNRGRLLTAEQYAAIGTYITYNNTRASQAGSDVNVWFAPGWVYEATGYGGFGTPNAATKLAAKTCGIPWGVGCELPQGIYIGAKASGPRTLAHELYHYFTGFGGEALPGNCGTINGNSPGCYKTPAEERDPARNRFPPWVKRLLP